jgi:hypothetical protein
MMERTVRDEILAGDYEVVAVWLGKGRSMSWMIGGYLDAKEKTQFKRAPAPKPPPGELTKEWRLYFEGWNSVPRLELPKRKK